MTIRGALLGFGAILWLAAGYCWWRARGNWRLSREGWLFLLLGVPFFVAGLFFTSSSYPQEVIAPVPTTPPPVAAVATPPPARPPPPAEQPEQYTQAVLASQRAAVARYPALGRSGTEFNTRFVTAYRQLRTRQPEYFSDPEWPLRLADEIARDLEEPQ